MAEFPAANGNPSGHYRRVQKLACSNPGCTATKVQWVPKPHPATKPNFP